MSHIIILGHSNCGGIHALCRHLQGERLERDFIERWVSIAADAVKPYVRDEPSCSEQAAIRASVENLKTFPWITERVESGRLSLHGWWFDLDVGELTVISEVDALSV